MFLSILSFLLTCIEESLESSFYEGKIYFDYASIFACNSKRRSGSLSGSL